MNMTNVESLKEELLRDNTAFRELASKHQKYEKRLTELAALMHPNDEELLEESVLKKKKLAVKDEMYAMLQEVATSH